MAVSFGEMDGETNAAFITAAIMHYGSYQSKTKDIKSMRGNGWSSVRANSNKS